MEYQIVERQGKKVIEVNTKVAVYQGLKWKDLSEYQKKKYENLVFLKNSDRTIHTKVIYIWNISQDIIVY